MKNGAQNGHNPKGRFTAGNSGGKPGRSGRVPNEVRATGVAWLRTLVDDPKARAAFAGVMRNPKHHQFASIWKLALSFTESLPASVVEHTGEVLNVHEHRQAFESRMDRITQRLGAAALPEWPER